MASIAPPPPNPNHSRVNEDLTLCQPKLHRESLKDNTDPGFAPRQALLGGVDSLQVLPDVCGVQDAGACDDGQQHHQGLWSVLRDAIFNLGAAAKCGVPRIYPYQVTGKYWKVDRPFPCLVSQEGFKCSC